MCKYYYDAVEAEEGYFGRVYHYENDRKVVDFKGTIVLQENKAIDEAAEWLEDNGIEAELG